MGGDIGDGDRPGGGAKAQQGLVLPQQRFRHVLGKPYQPKHLRASGRVHYVLGRWGKARRIEHGVLLASVALHGVAARQQNVAVPPRFDLAVDRA